MKHENIKQLISQEIDGEVTSSEIQLINQHIGECQECRKYKDELNQLSGLMRSVDDEVLSADLEHKIAQTLEEVSPLREEIQMKPKNRLIKYGFGGGVLLSIVLAVVAMQTYSQRTMQARVRDASQYLASHTPILKRGVQGRLKNATDDTGGQFSTGNTSALKLASSKTNQGQWKAPGSDLGGQYDPSSGRENQQLAYNNRGQAMLATESIGSTNQYEPYYLTSDYTIDQKAEVQKSASAPVQLIAKADTSNVRREGGFQMSSYDRSMNPVSAFEYKPERMSGIVGDKELNEQRFDLAKGKRKFADYDDRYRQNIPARASGVVMYEAEMPAEMIGRERDEEAYRALDQVGYIQHQQPRYVQYSTEDYQHIYENHFVKSWTNPLSTFSIDVDTASYSNVRRFLTSNQMPPVNAVRVEEMINYFDYNYPEPFWGQPFSITTNGARAPWNTNHYLVQIGIKGKTLKKSQVPPSNIVFLIDVSGSMNQANKLPLLKKSLSMMVDQLGPNERVAIVTYSGHAGLVLNSTPGSNKYAIHKAINNLHAGGSTAGAQGIRLAYDVARQNFIQKGNNRVILATDGDFNVGVSSDQELVRLIEQERNDGVFLSILGFGTGNLKDAKMKQIANKGNGAYYYIDNMTEGEKVLVNELGSTLFTIAKDVKIQVEFNPEQVAHYKLIGYEDRMLRKEDFNNDTIDAGELGAGHTVTALYEIVPTQLDGRTNNPLVDPLVYQARKGVKLFQNQDLLTVKLRYKEPDGFESKLLKKTLKKSKIVKVASHDLQFAAAVAEFGLLLRHSPARGYASYDRVLRNAQTAIGEDKNGYRNEFIGLVQKAQQLDRRVNHYTNPYPVEDQHLLRTESGSEIQFK